MLRVAPKVQNQGARGDSDGSICGLSGTGPQNRTPQLPPKPQITLATREPSTVHGPQPIADTADGRRQKFEADFIARAPGVRRVAPRSEEHTSKLQSLMRISYAVFCLTKKRTYT